MGNVLRGLLLIVLLAMTAPAHAVSNLSLPFVLDNTMLSLLPSTQYLSIWRLGFASVGDASTPTLYTPSNSACTQNAGAGDGGSCNPSASGGSWRAVRPTLGFDISAFGPTYATSLAACLAAAPNMGACLGGSLAGATKPTHSFNFPTLSSVPIAAQWVDINAYPAAGLIPAGVPSGYTSSMVVPSSYTQAPWPATNYSGYCDNQNIAATGNSCVPYFSVGLADGGVQTTAYGGNPILSNTDPTHYLSGAGFGKDFGALFGNECDANVWTKAAGATPAGTLKCFEAIGGGNVIPSGGAYAFHVDPFAVGIPWTYAFVTEDGAATGALLVAALGAAPNQDSQAVNFRTWNASSAEKTATIKAAHNANSLDLDLSANDSNGRVAFQVNAVTQYYVDNTGLVGVSGALATSATGPFMYTNTVPGVLTGVPTNAGAGRAAFWVDSTNHKWCWYENGTGVKCATGL